MSTIIDRSAPSVHVAVLPHEKAESGAPLDIRSRLLGFVFDDTVKTADKVTLQLDNSDLSLFESESFMAGTLLEVSWGYPGHMSIPRRMVLKKLKGFQRLEVEGLARSALMNQETKTRTFSQLTRADVALQIANEHGYQGAFMDVEATDEVYDVIHQSRETDARFLRRLAAREGYEFYVDAGGFHFREVNQRSTPSHVLTWFSDPGRGDIVSIAVESNLVKRVGKVTVKGRDPLEKQTIEASASNETDADRATMGGVIEVFDPETGASSAVQRRNATSTVHATSASKPARAKREAKARFRKAERGTVKLSMRVVGDPTLHAKSIVEVRGVSALLSGKYYVQAAKHQIGQGGYTTELKLVKDAVGRRARRIGEEQRGETNRKNTRDKDELEVIEVIDKETGETRIEYRRLEAVEDKAAGMSVLVKKE